MKIKKSKIIISLLVCAAIFTQTALPAFAWGRGGREGWDDPYPHGTVDYTITEDMVNNAPPADYEINSQSQADAKDGLYNQFFLEDSIQTVSITIDETNLNYLLQNAADEPYVMTDSVTIGDTTLGYCGLRTKGNYTLAHAVTDNPGSDRFSFTVNFGKFIKKADYGEKQNFYGCDKISFNNFFFDKTMMKEFFSLKLMDEMGLPTPQYGLARLYINDQYYGVYAMVEALDTPILEQYFDCDKSELSDYLTKPVGTTLDYYDLLEDQSPLWEYDQDTYNDVEAMLPTVMEWVRRLNCLSQGTDFDGAELDVNSDAYLELLGQVLNVDEVVRYFAVHSWLCQMDNMFMCQQNYGIYISEEGVCTIVPWDYDLAFGCYFPSTAENTANYPIDIMYSLERRDWEDHEERTERAYKRFPLFNVIYQNESLMERYHEYMKECSKVAALGGTVESTGTTYAPGYFNSYIEKMQDELISAASEELADNVYYMNRIEQPGDVRKGLPNLSKIIAMRAVGVLLQVDGLEATVCASGCDLEALGNGARGSVSNSGRLSLVDPSTGIFITADYEGGDRKAAPGLTVNALPEDDSYYEELSRLALALPTDSVKVYQIKAGVQPTSAYTVSVPLSAEDMALGTIHRFYVYSGDKLSLMSMSRDDNIFTGEAESIEYLVVVSSPVTSTLLCVGTSAVVAVLAVAAVKLFTAKKGGTHEKG